MLYIILIFIAIFVYLIYKNLKHEKAKQVNAEEILQKAQENKEKILAKCRRHNLYIDEIDMVEAIETDTIRLCERYKHNSKIVIQVLNDYLDYTTALLKIINAKRLDDAKSSVGYSDSLEEYHTEIKKPRIIVQEIGRRIIEMSGDTSKYKEVLEKPSSCVTPADTGKVKIGDIYR